MRNLFYTGIGSRDIPIDISELMSKIAHKLCLLGYHLRSGAADGSDTSFEHGVLTALGSDFDKYDSSISVYLPWSSFGKRNRVNNPYARVLDHPETEQLVKIHHPNADKLTHSVMSLMRRNCHQVLGDDLSTPSAFIICWTPDGVEQGAATTQYTGGTGMAIRIASANNIKVFNLANKISYERIKKWLEVEGVHHAGVRQD